MKLFLIDFLLVNVLVIFSWKWAGFWAQLALIYLGADWA